MEKSDATEMSNNTASDSGVGAEQNSGSGESSDAYKFDASLLMDPKLTETVIEGNDWDNEPKKRGKYEPLLAGEKQIKLMKKQNFAAIGENSSSVHNLYELNGNHCDVTDVKLVWRNLSCKVNTTNLRKWKSFPWFKFQRCSKTILQEQSGSIKVGVLTAVVGPSGAGKSTFLECLSGKKRTTRKGDVYVTSANIKTKTGTFNTSIEDIRQLSVSFIAQKDHLIGVLTVRESLLFASKLKNYREKWEVMKGRRDSLKSKGIKTIEDFHTYVVETVLSEFGLEGCSDVFVNKCSGGQAKRLSIALELVSRPKILILDEPTSGLDSSSALQCVQVLKQLTVTRSNMKAPLAIIASIHQPSARLLYEFENVYILSNDGRCLYHGSVSNLLNHFSRFGLQCPQFHNPADFIMEVATATYGTKCMDELALYERRQQAIESVEEEHKQKYKITYIVDKMTKQRFPTFLHAWLLLQRTWKNTIREPMLTWLRLIQHVVVALVASYMYNYKVGEANGCFSDLTEAFHFNATSQPGSLGDIQEKFIRQQSAALTNVGLAYFTILFLAFANSSATCLTFPLEMSVFIKERRNSWYSCGTYFMSKFIADTPFQIIIPIIFSAIMFVATGQTPSWWRFGMYCVICIFTASISQGIGILFGILFLEDVSSAVFTAVLVQTPFFLLGGFLVKYSGVNILLQPIAIISYVRYCFESLIVIIYGFSRCKSSSSTGISSEQQSLADIACLFGSEEAKNSDLKTWITELKSSNITEVLVSLFDVEKGCAAKLANKFQEMREGFKDESSVDVVPNETSISSLHDSSSSSYILMEYELNDHNLWTHLIILAIFLIVLRIGAYLLLLYKTNKKLKE